VAAATPAFREDAMKHYAGRPQMEDRVTLACSCEGDVVVPIIIMVPRHCVVRIVARGEKCRIGHILRSRVVVRWTRRGTRRLFVDIHDV
jgi:hypothetical protein